MKKIHLSAVSGLLSLCLLCGCAQTEQAGASSAQSTSDTTSNNAEELITDIPTTQYFTDDPVKENDIETILMAGINAPSAMNGQPWHFSVVMDAAVLQQISDGMSGGMGFGGKMPLNGMAMPGGTLPENMTPPEGMELPEGMEVPEGFEPAVTDYPENSAGGSANAMPFPEMPENMELPEGVTPPEGMEPPEGMSPPTGFVGGAGSGGAAKAGLTDAPLAIVVSCTEGSELDAGLACQNMSVTAQLLGYGTKIISSPTIALNGEKQDEYRELLGIPEPHSAVAVLLVGYADTTIDETVDGYTGATARNPFEELVTYINAE